MSNMTGMPQFRTTAHNGWLYAISHVVIIWLYLLLGFVIFRHIEQWFLRFLAESAFLFPVCVNLLNRFSTRTVLVLAACLTLIGCAIASLDHPGRFALLHILFGIAVVPLALWIAMHPNEWDMGLRNRGWLTSFCIVNLLLIFAVPAVEQGKELSRLLSSGVDSFRLPLGIWLSLPYQIMTGRFSEIWTLANPGVVMLQICVPVMLLMKYLTELQSDKIPLVMSKARVTFRFVSLALVIITSLAADWDLALGSIAPDLRMDFLAPVYLFVMVQMYDQELFISRTKAQIRRFVRGLRHDRIRQLTSPTLKPANLILRLRHFISRQFREISPRTLAVLIFLSCALGAMVIDLWLFKHFSFVSDIQPSVSPVLTGVDTGNASPDSSVSLYSELEFGLFAGITSATFFLFYWYLRERPKHLVFLFTVVEDKTSIQAELRPLAQFVTYTFTEELQRIGHLLKSRQVENINSSDSSSLSQFVTSGSDIEPIGDLASIELPEKGRFSLSTLLALVYRVIAVTTIRGHVQMREDNSVQVQVQVSRRGGQTFSEDTVIVPDAPNGKVGEEFAWSPTRELAAKLVFKMGQAAHLASSFESFKYFLDGLDASWQENWAQAITRYRRAIQIEETERGSFGAGHYHLGAALVFQGEIGEGLIHLRIAEQSGPPLPETHYMVALASLYKSVARLVEDGVYQDIVDHCETALRLRPFFPEANFLLGTIHYKRGQLCEERQNDSYGAENDGNLSIEIGWNANKQHYRSANRSLYRAIQQYDALLRDPGKRLATQATGDKEHTRLLKERMAATHRLADALRSLELYSEADSYYEDVLQGFPMDERTLLDRAKTFCLAGNWQAGVEFIWNRLMPSHIASTNPAANFYLGWAIIGGLTSEHLPTEKAQCYLCQAVEALDYAFLARPRTIIEWKRRNLSVQLEKARNIAGPNSFPDWISWRIDSFASDIQCEPPESERIRQDRRRIVECLQITKTGTNKTEKPMDWWLQWNRLTLALSLQSSWNDNKLSDTCEQTPLGWWKADAFAEHTLMTGRMLCDAGAFEEAVKVCEEGLKILDKTGRETLNNWTRKTVGHQKAALHAWLAYAILQCSEDIATRIRIEGADNQAQQDILLKDHINKALEYENQQPLALFVRAQCLRKNGYLREATDDLHQLLHSLDSFDPYLYTTLNIDDWEAISVYQSDTSKGSQEAATLNRMGWTTGARQYDLVISKSQVHAAGMRDGRAPRRPEQSPI